MSEMKECTQKGAKPHDIYLRDGTSLITHPNYNHYEPIVFFLVLDFNSL